MFNTNNSFVPSAANFTNEIQILFSGIVNNSKTEMTIFYFYALCGLFEMSPSNLLIKKCLKTFRRTAFTYAEDDFKLGDKYAYLAFDSTDSLESNNTDENIRLLFDYACYKHYNEYLERYRYSNDDENEKIKIIGQLLEEMPVNIEVELWLDLFIGVFYYNRPDFLLYLDPDEWTDLSPQNKLKTFLRYTSQYRY